MMDLEKDIGELNRCLSQINEPIDELTLGRIDKIVNDINARFKYLSETKQVANDFHVHYRVTESLSEFALELCLVTCSKPDKEWLLEDITKIAKGKEWVALQDKIRAFALDDRTQPMQQTFLDCAMHIQNPAHLFPIQAYLLGEFLVAQDHLV